MAAELPPGSRTTDYISPGVIAKTLPDPAIGAVLDQTGEASIRQRYLPANIVVYYVTALTLCMRSPYREVVCCPLGGVRWLRNPTAAVNVAAKLGSSRARARIWLEACAAVAG